MATTQVICWLNRYKKKFVRLNGEENYKILEISDRKIIVQKQSLKINLFDCSSYWYRRDGVNSKQLNISLAKEKTKKIPEEIFDNKNFEYKVLKEHIYRMLEANAKKKIGSYFTRSMNKLDVIKYAQEYRLNIPYSCLVFNKSQLESIIEKNDVITKAVNEGIFFEHKNKIYISYTSQILKNDINAFSETFMPSLIQEKIKKKYELRIFYIKGEIYSSVIFSQNNIESEVDCRRAFDFRYLPYNLPVTISFKLKSLMKKLKLNSGSIDMIVDENNRYVFLEVNPVGQFVSYGESCNYFLDKELAKKL